MSVVLPDAACYRIMGHTSRHYLYAQTQLDSTEPEPPIAQSKTSPLDPDNQLFFVRSAGRWNGGRGYFTIQGKLSAKCISLDNSNKRVITTLRQTGNVPTNENFVRLIQHPTDKSLVRIVGSSYSITSSGDPYPALSLVPQGSGITNEQYFQFIMEDVAVKNIDFKYPARKEVRRTPLSDMWGQTKTNTSQSTTETMSIAVTKEVSYLSKFEYQDGYTLKAGFEIQLSLDQYVKGGATASAEKSTTTTWTLGEQKTDKVLYRPIFKIQVPPRTEKTVLATCFLVDLEIPYTVVLILIRNNTSITMNGVWRGQLWDVKLDETEKKI